MGRRTALLLLLVVTVLIGLGIGALTLRDSGVPSGDQLLVGTSASREPGETYEQAWQRRVSTWQTEPDMARFYFPELPVGGWPEFGDAQVMASFKLPVVDGRADVAGLLAGAYDQQLTTWFTSMPADEVPKYVAFWHEPEDDVAAGLFTSAEFREAFEHVRDLAAPFEGTGRNINIGVVLMGWTAAPASGRNPDDYLPPGASFVGWDIYPRASKSDTYARYAMAAEVARETGVPQWFLAETALRRTEEPTQSETAAWIPMAADTARSLGYSGLLYFDSTVGGDFRLTTSETWLAMNREITGNGRG